MAKLKSFIPQIDEKLEANAAKQEKVKSESVRIGQELEDTFASYLTLVTDRLMVLKKNLEKQTQVQMDALLEQQSNLEKLRDTVEGGLEKQDGWIRGQEMERKERETKVDEIASAVLTEFEQHTKPLEIKDIVYTRDDDAVSEVFNTIHIMLMCLHFPQLSG